MSHHYSGPDFGFPHGDARLDFTDLYAFPKPGDAGKSILIMNVHPSYTIVDPRPSTKEPFAPNGLYEIKIDTNGDAVADIAYRMRATSAPGGTQTATLRRAEGAEAAATSDGGDIVIEGAPVSAGRDARVTDKGGIRFFAGWRSDPFFFDTVGALNGLKYTGADYFADKNVCSIALELPNSALGAKTVRLWARTLLVDNGRVVPVERGARPQQAVFLLGDARDAYFAAEPKDDARFIPVLAHSLEHTGGYSPEDAKRAAAKLLPDLLPFEPGRPAAFPDNGRTLTDDAARVFQTILTNNNINGTWGGAHKDILGEFPYAGSPHGA